MQHLPPVEHFRSSTGVDIYRFSMQLFPNGFDGHAFILEGVGQLTLIDCGSGIGTSNDDLLAGFLRDQRTIWKNRTRCGT